MQPHLATCSPPHQPPPTPPTPPNPPPTTYPPTLSLCRWPARRYPSWCPVLTWPITCCAPTLPTSSFPRRTPSSWRRCRWDACPPRRPLPAPPCCAAPAMGRPCRGSRVRHARRCTDAPPPNPARRSTGRPSLPSLRRHAEALGLSSGMRQHPPATCPSLQDIPAGTEACISYGGTHKDNEGMMRDYGFVIPGNVNDRVPFSAGARAPQGLVLSRAVG